MTRSLRLLAVACTLLWQTQIALAQTQSFSDVPKGHPAYDAVEYLKTQGIIGGYPDGTYRPDKKVNRAEAVKIIAAPLVKAEEVAGKTSTVFSDIAADAWFLPYVELAREKLGIVDGPPKKTAFLGDNPVLKVEFIKMLLLAHKADPVGAFAEIRLPLSDDVTNSDEWFYPYLRYALASSMTMLDTNTGTLGPARELTRGEVALLLYRYLMYKQGRRTQALLSEAENEIIVILNSLEKKNIDQAEYASARALIAARGAHASQPDVPLVQGAVKTAEAFRALVRAYRSGMSGDNEGVVKLAGDAWNLADRARELAPDLATVSGQIQAIAKNMADSARTLMAQPQPTPPS